MAGTHARDRRIAAGEWGAFKRSVVEAHARLAAHVEGMILESNGKSSFDVIGAVAAIPWTELYEEPILQGWQESAWGALKRMVRVERSRFLRSVGKAATDVAAVSLEDEMALQWVDTRGLELVKRMSQRARRASRKVIADAVQDGSSIRTTVRRLRSIIGLSDRDEETMHNRWKRLQGKKKPAAIDADLRRYRDKLIAARAKALAVTETVAAREAGRAHAWKVLQSEGELEHTAKKRWVPGLKACGKCMEAAASPPVPIDEPYRTSSGTVFAPPLHTHCDCGQELVT